MGLATPLILSSLYWPVFLFYYFPLFMSPYSQSFYSGPFPIFWACPSLSRPVLLISACTFILGMSFHFAPDLSCLASTLLLCQSVCPLILELSFLSGPISEFAVSKTPNHVSLVSLVSRVTRQDSGWGQTP